MNDKNSKREKGTPGPKPETLKAEGASWEDAVAHALQKKKPKGGWPDGSDRDKSKKKK